MQCRVLNAPPQLLLLTGFACMHAACFVFRGLHIAGLERLKREVEESNIRVFLEGFAGVHMLVAIEELVRQPGEQVRKSLLPVDGMVQKALTKIHQSIDGVADSATQVREATNNWEMFLGELSQRWRVFYTGVISVSFAEFAINFCGGIDALPSDILRDELSHLSRQLTYMRNAAQARWESGLQLIKQHRSDMELLQTVDEILNQFVSEVVNERAAGGSGTHIRADEVLASASEKVQAQMHDRIAETQAAYATPAYALDHAELTHVLLPSNLPSCLCSDADRATLRQAVDEIQADQARPDEGWDVRIAAAGENPINPATEFANIMHFRSWINTQPSPQHWTDRLRGVVYQQCWVEFYNRCRSVPWDREAGHRLFKLPEAVQQLLWRAGGDPVRPELAEHHHQLMCMIGNTFLLTESPEQRFMCVGVVFEPASFRAATSKARGSFALLLLAFQSGVVFKVPCGIVQRDYDIHRTHSVNFKNQRTIDGEPVCLEVGCSIELLKPTPSIRSTVPAALAEHWFETLPNAMQWYHQHTKLASLKGVIVGMTELPRCNDGPACQGYICRFHRIPGTGSGAKEPMALPSFITVPTQVVHQQGTASRSASSMLQLPPDVLRPMLRVLAQQRMADHKNRMQAKCAAEVARLRDLYLGVLEDARRQLADAGDLVACLRSAFTQLRTSCIAKLTPAACSVVQHRLDSMDSMLNTDELLTKAMHWAFTTRGPAAKSNILNYVVSREQSVQTYFFQHQFQRKVADVVDSVRTTLQSSFVDVTHVLSMASATSMHALPTIASCVELMHQRLQTWIEKARATDSDVPLSATPVSLMPSGHACMQALAYIHSAHDDYLLIQPQEGDVGMTGMRPAILPAGSAILPFADGLAATQTALALSGGNCEMTWSAICESLQGSFRQTVAGPPFEINIPDTAIEYDHAGAFARVYGCRAQCPYCAQKCSERSPGHEGKHRCSHHLIAALGGWRDSRSQQATLQCCSEPRAFRMRWQDTRRDQLDENGERPYLPFAEHIEACNPDWEIVQESSSAMVAFEQNAFAYARRELAAQWRYKVDFVPEEWKLGAAEWFGATLEDEDGSGDESRRPQ